MSRPRLLDLFSGEGGAATGYHRAGFDVTGVDHRPMPRYPFAHVVADAFDHLREHGHEYDAIHASPPCQAYSRARHTPGSVGRAYPGLLAATREALMATGKPWVIENVDLAPMTGVMLCGTMLGLRVRRHRLFESSLMLMAPGNGCRHRKGDLTVFGSCVQVCGSRGVAYVARSGRTHYRPLRVRTRDGAEAMGCQWMSGDGLSESIPPAYAEFVGRQLLRSLQRGDS